MVELKLSGTSMNSMPNFFAELACDVSISAGRRLKLIAVLCLLMTMISGQTHRTNTIKLSGLETWIRNLDREVKGLREPIAYI